MSKAANDHDDTMSVASEDDVQLQFVSSFETVLRDTDDESSVPPPPPPSSGRSLRAIGGSFFWAKEKYLKSPNDDEETGDLRPVEVIASQDESKANIEVDAAEQWIKNFGVNEQRNSRKRRALYCTAIVLSFALLLGIAIGLSGNSNKQRTSQSKNMLVGSPTITDPPNVSMSTSIPEPEMEASMAPTNSTESPMAEFPMNATVFPTNVPEESTEVCNTLLVSQQDCYPRRTDVAISFTNCQPESNDWMGIWKVDEVVDPTSLPEPALWLWSCGSEDCEGAVREGVLLFSGGLPVGTYVAHLVRMEQDRAPYTGSYAFSTSFDVSRNCD